MNLKFTKMHGAGNDFVALDGRETDVPWRDSAAMARIGARRTGIGCEGFLVLLPAEEPGTAFRLVFLNPDGSAAELCGNGTRCAALYGLRRGFAKTAAFRIATGAGIVEAEVLREDPADGLVRLRLQPASAPVRRTVEVLGVGAVEGHISDFGASALHGVLPPALCATPLSEGGNTRGKPPAERGVAPQGPGGVLRAKPMTAENGDALAVKCVCVDSGVPHAVAFVPDADAVDVRGLGRTLRWHSAFTPAGTNVDFVQRTGPAALRMRTYERGVEDESGACGTGAVAAAVAAAEEFADMEFPVRIRVTSGDELVVDPREAAGPLLTGPACEVFRGELPETTFSNH